MSQSFKAVFYALLATALFATVAAMAKLAVRDYHILQILFFRQLIVLATTLPTISRDFPSSLRTKKPLIHAFRLTGAFAALSLSILSVAHLPLTTATTLGFANILFVALLGAMFLGEAMPPRRLFAIILGFFGIVIAMRPDMNGLANPYCFAALAAALGAAVAAVSVRHLSQTESTATLLAYQAIFIGLLCAFPMIWLWKQPDWQDTLFLLAMGCLSAMGQWLGIKALRFGEASIVKSFDYVSLIYAAGLGYVLFGEIPDERTMVGSVVIIFAALYMIHGLHTKPNVPLSAPGQQS